MRLWHIDLIPYLPKSQLIAQWRELNSIYAKEDKHILINYIYDYPKEYLLCYSDKVIDEMINRGIRIKSYEKYAQYFKETQHENTALKYNEHNDLYLNICWWNLREKYIRGQKDFDKDTFDKLQKFVCFG